MTGNSIDPEVVRAELDKILASKRFANVKVLQELLRFLAEHEIAGGPPLDEETIAAKVFGRVENFVAQLDPVVRVQYRRLKAALTDHYESEGRPSRLMLGTQDDGFGLAIVDREAVRAAQRRRKPLKLGAVVALLAAIVLIVMAVRFEHRRQAVRQAENIEQRAQELMQKATPSNAATSARLFEEALQHNSDSEQAWSGLASALIVPGANKDLSRPEALAKASEAAAKAVSLDPTDGIAHATLGYTRLFQDADWVTAEAEFRRAVQLSPSVARIHAMYAQGLMSRGRFDEAIAQSKLAASLQPQGTAPSADLAEILAAAHRHDEAIAEARRVLQASSSSPSAHLGLGIALSGAGHYADAITEYQAALMTGSSLYALARLGYAYGASGDKVAAEGVLGRLSEAFARMATIDWTYRGMVYAGLGDKARAVACLENGAANHEGDLLFIGVDPVWDSLRAEPGFLALKKHMNLP